MLFNSYEFILVFLPLTVAGFFFAGLSSRAAAQTWLIVASVFFYAFWRLENLWVLTVSLLANYLFARALLKAIASDQHARLKPLVLTLGIAFNLGLLGYFKYANFFVSVASDVSGAQFAIEAIILPLGLSFITFQKIAFLVDVAGGRIKTFSVRDFLLFVLFFPQLIAGPIVHYREMAPQFEGLAGRFKTRMAAVGLTLFCIGLFKKAVLADGMAESVSPIYAFAAAGGSVTLIQGWIAAVGFTLQLYFDFSAYSDMASGVALILGMKMPLNFDSPLKASSIIEYWSRWHMTLTRFLTAYVYNPLALSLARARARKGRPGLRSRGSDAGAFVLLLAYPTLVTMLISGVWHGAGYTFILWGAIHGVLLVINHAWRQYFPVDRAQRTSNRASLLASFALTFLTVCITMVLFRASDLPGAVQIYEGMLGLSGLSLPSDLASVLHVRAPEMLLLDGPVQSRALVESLSMLASLLAIAVLLPNAMQLLAAEEPALQLPARPARLFNIGAVMSWRPNIAWFLLIAALALVSMFRLTGKSEFLYWQF